MYGFIIIGIIVAGGTIVSFFVDVSKKNNETKKLVSQVKSERAINDAVEIYTEKYGEAPSNNDDLVHSGLLSKNAFIVKASDDYNGVMSGSMDLFQKVIATYLENSADITASSALLETINSNIAGDPNGDDIQDNYNLLPLSIRTKFSLKRFEAIYVAINTVEVSGNEVKYSGIDDKYKDRISGIKGADSLRVYDSVTKKTTKLMSAKERALIRGRVESKIKKVYLITGDIQKSMYAGASTFMGSQNLVAMNALNLSKLKKASYKVLNELGLSRFNPLDAPIFNSVKTMDIATINNNVILYNSI
ncbi:MAG: hypothetical protein HOG49_33635 [Candidatus Scalindua sp.]|jgi:hypothetical protein|nr:hypothetical protein [Candidatus Scalindua sp.]